MSSSSFKDEESILQNHTGTVVDLVSKMVNFEQNFHLTLIGVAVTDFVTVAEKKGGIQAFLAKKKSPELSTSNGVLF